MRIEYYRKKSGMMQWELAEKMGVSQQAVSDWETGKKNPSTGKLLELSRVLNCTTDELLGNKN